MKIGILSDAHGNLIGLKKCINFLHDQNVEQLFYLGDMVGYLPDANQVIEVVKQNCDLVLKGNHEAMLLGELPFSSEQDNVYQLVRTRNDITAENIDYIRTLESRKEYMIDNVNILLVHASPIDTLTGYIYPDTEIAFNDIEAYDAVFMGHTHRPFTKKIVNTCVINVGSCGMPRDYGKYASCAIYDTQLCEANIFRIIMEYDEIVDKYATFAHSSVLDLFKRTTDNLIGTIV